MSAIRLVMLLAVSATLAAANNKLLPSAGASCNDVFKQIISDNYADDSTCQDLIKTAMSTAPTSSSECPGGGIANPGSDVHKCMTKSQQTKDAWVSFIRRCEVMNVNERAGAGEAEAAADPQPSCFPRFNSLQAFVDYMGASAATSAAGAAAVSMSAALVAAAGLALLL